MTLVLYPQGSSLPILRLMQVLRTLGARLVWGGLGRGVLGKSPDSPGLFFSITSLHSPSSHHLLKSFSPLRLALWTVLPNVLNKSLLSYYCVLMEHKSSKEPTRMPLHEFFMGKHYAIASIFPTSWIIVIFEKCVCISKLFSCFFK